MLLEISAKFSISGIVNPSLFFINSTNFFCFSPFSSFTLISSYGMFKYTKFIFLSFTLSSLFLAPLVWLKITKKEIKNPNKKKWYEDDGPEEKAVKGINA